MDELTAWSRDLTVEVGGHGVVSHTGSAALRLLADRTGLTGALSRALRRRGFTPVHDRGRVLADAAVLIADGGRVLSDLAVLRDQAELFGPVASDPTLWRALDEIGPDQRERIAAARAKVRRHVWGLIEARHGRIPASRVADRDLGDTIVIRMDATIQIAHSDKQQAAGTFKGTWGHHSLTAWCDNTVRHEALRIRAEVRGLRLPVVAAAGCSWGQPDSGRCREGWQAAPTKSGRTGTTRRAGPGERDEKAYERNQCHNAPSSADTTSNLVDRGWERCVPARSAVRAGVGNSWAGLCCR